MESIPTELSHLNYYRRGLVKTKTSFIILQWKEKTTKAINAKEYRGLSNTPTNLCTPLYCIIST